MKTSQLVMASANLDTAGLADLVPPQCAEGPVGALRWQADGTGTLASDLDLSSALLRDGTRIVPCFSAASAGDYGYQFQLEFEACDGGRGRTSALSPVGATGLWPSRGGAAGTPLPSASPVAADIDTFSLNDAITGARLKLRVRAEDPDDLAGAPALVSASVRADTGGDPGDQAPTGNDSVDIPVPPRSQMLEDECLGPRICSPTSVSMVLAHHGLEATPAQIARLAYHPSHDLYGVWPSAVYAASRWGALGYLLQFPSWPAAQWLLDRGLPLVASIRYGRGELANAAVPQTAGHLVVVRGYDRDTVRVNDPAADTVGEVGRAYIRDEFIRAWLEASGLGYVLFPA